MEKRDEPLMEQSASWLAFINYGELQLLTLHKKSLILSDTFSGKLVFLLHCSNIVSVQKVHGRNFIKIVFFTVNKSGVKQYDDIVIVPLIEREKDDIVSAFMKIRGASKHSTMHGVSIIDVDGELSENHNPNKLKIRGDALITKWKLLILSHSNIVITQVEDAQKAFTHIANFAYTDIISFTIKGENCIISFSNGQSFVFRILPLTYDDTETLHNKASVLKTLLQSRVSFSSVVFTSFPFSSIDVSLLVDLCSVAFGSLAFLVAFVSLAAFVSILTFFTFIFFSCFPYSFPVLSPSTWSDCSGNSKYPAVICL